jgi:hypothetical protein
MPAVRGSERRVRVAALALPLVPVAPAVPPWRLRAAEADESFAVCV